MLLKLDIKLKIIVKTAIIYPNKNILGKIILKNLLLALLLKVANTDADITNVFVKLRSLSIASTEALISLTAGFPSILSIINL